jgi:hypothetical protein
MGETDGRDPAREAARLETLTRLTAHVKVLESLERRSTTQQAHATGVAAYRRYAASVGIYPFPAEVPHLINFVAHGLFLMDWEGKTVSSYLEGVSALHERLVSLGVIDENPSADGRLKKIKRTATANFKKASRAKKAFSLDVIIKMMSAFVDTRASWHIRLSLWIRMLGCIRTSAASVIQVRYSVDTTGNITFAADSHVSIRRDEDLDLEYVHIEVHADKNRNNTMHIREVVIPARVPAINCWPVDELRHYLRTYRPNSSNHFLLACPRGNAAWSSYRPDKYGRVKGHNPNSKFKLLLKKACPNMSDTRRNEFATTSLRKTLAQVLFEDGWPETVRADLGAWSITHRGIDAYFTTPNNLRLIALGRLGERQGVRYFAPRA